MNLLVFTRKVDTKDERAGFFFDWLLEFSKYCQHLIIICQEKGETRGLPDNIEVYSLGKDLGYSKFKQLLRFEMFVVRRLSSVDGVFTHMMPIYALLVGPWCKLYHKKLIHWYTHKSVDWRLRLAGLFVNEFVTASRASFRLQTKKSVKVLGHGIDIKKFTIQSSNSTGRQAQGERRQININERFNILTVGRISPVKNIDLLIKAIEKIQLDEPELRHKVSVQIVGGPGLLSQASYLKDLEEEVKNKNLGEMVRFFGPEPPEAVIDHYRECDLFVNLSETGSVDKAVLEAMACGRLVLSSNEAFQEILPAEFYLAHKDLGLLVQKIKEIYLMPDSEKKKWQNNLRQIVVDNHNLEKLIQKIVNLF